ncbi:MAG: LacI family transcriptional regulator [Propionibacteriaceae bacterium]|jgi:DNA-binding LacI/PurR family transcriptional regulator|nr:LacI family transcriptional regulator [Propionibacteriaceae bacterium]
MKAHHAAATMTDVAQAAGVSHQTVSRVLNNHPSVSSATRRAVLDAITSLDYRRNLAARALVTGSSHVIGILVSSTSQSGPVSNLLAMESVARARGYWASIAGLRDNDPQEVTDIISHFTDQGVDGIVAVAQTQATVEAMLAAHVNVPTVLLTAATVPAEISSADIDQASGARKALGHLRELGHVTIAHISGPETDLHAAARHGAWLASLPATADPEALMAVGDWSAMSGYRAACRLLAGSSGPTAIFAANDRMAYGALRALSEHGIRVPYEMSIVGFDDIEESTCSIPPLTTIRQDHTQLGSTAMQSLIDAMRGEPARCVKIDPDLIVRNSAGAPNH